MSLPTPPLNQVLASLGAYDDKISHRAVDCLSKSVGTKCPEHNAECWLLIFASGLLSFKKGISGGASRQKVGGTEAKGGPGAEPPEKFFGATPFPPRKRPFSLR